MARKIQLKTVSLGPGMADENGQPARLIYGRMIETILRFAPPGRGLTLDEVTRAMEALTPVTEAIERGADEVVLSEDAWRTLKEKMEAFQFGLAHEAIVDFGNTVRNAPELGTEPIRQVPRTDRLPHHAAE